MAASTNFSNRYAILDKLGEGGMGVVYSAYDKLNRSQVAFKKLHRNEHASWGTQDASKKKTLAHEFQVLASLKHPNIISVIDYGFADDLEPYFTMSLLEKPKDIVAYGANLSVEDRVDLIIQMLLALAYLHRNGIVHRDLKPDNALVTPDGKLRLLDFGIALFSKRNEGNKSPSLSGTVSYMAPEVIIGDPVEPTSDLYAVGIIAYELFVGEHPFNLENLSLLMQDVMHTDPDIDLLTTNMKTIRQRITRRFIKMEDDTISEGTKLREELASSSGDNIAENIAGDKARETAEGKLSASDVPFLNENMVEELAKVFQKLLSKEPQDRYQSAQETIEAICNILQRPLPNDVAIRESYLQAAKFVGREEELNQMRMALTDAVDGEGSAWLIGGESGVGKTRLINELRVDAMVQGTLVLTGQGISDGGLHYQFWRDTLRRLIIDVEITDTEASILKTIIPDISSLIGRTVEDAPELEETGKTRLINTIVAVFKKVDQPIMLILEDLQWASESLDILTALLPLTKEMKLFIIGTYRTDEAAELAEKLPSMNHIQLDRLDEDAIRDLSGSMLGQVGQKPDIVKRLIQESEGNVFFLVEVVRALAEEAGNLSRIDQIELPERILTGGIQEIMERRINRVPSTSRIVLEFAAIAGRYIDTKIIHEAMPALDIEKWLTECASADVIEVIEGQWRFEHEKIRESLMESIEANKKSMMHHQVAGIMEKSYGDQADYAMIICDHYEKANDPEAAAKWYIPAAIHARNAYVSDTAITYFEKAIQFWKDHPDEIKNFSIEERLDTYIGLGYMYFFQARHDDAISTLETMIGIAKEHDQKGKVAHGLARIAYSLLYLGKADDALVKLEESEKIATEIDDQLTLGKVLWVRGIIMYMSGKLQEVLEIGTKLLSIAEKADDQFHLAQGLNMVGAVNYSVGNYKEAATNFERQYTVSTQIGDQGPAISALNNLAMVTEGRGNYEDAEDIYRRALSEIDKLGIRSEELLFQSNLGGLLVRMEKFREAQDLLQRVIEQAQDVAFGELSETYRFLARAQNGQDRHEDALKSAQKSYQLAEEAGSPDFLAGAWRVLGEVASRLSEEVAPNPDKPDETFEANICFEKSAAMYEENGMVGNQARTLRAWARHERRQFNLDGYKEKWEKAKALFELIGADYEVERMS